MYYATITPDHPCNAAGTEGEYNLEIRGDDSNDVLYIRGSLSSYAEYAFLKRFFDGADEIEWHLEPGRAVVEGVLPSNPVKL